jgi:hypothetical protein
VSNLGVFGAAATEAGGTGDHLTAITVSGLSSGVITAASIAASALDGKGNWNVGKTGYTLVSTTGLGNQTANITGNLSGSVGSVSGDVAGKVLGGGSGTISGVGARVVDYNGDNVAPAATALSSSTWTNALASALTTAVTSVATLLTRIAGTLASGTHQPQSGDSYARLGSPAGASIAADIAAVGNGVVVHLSRPSYVPETAISSGKVSAWRGDTFSGQFTGLGSLVDCEKIQFTLKSSTDQEDSEASLIVEWDGTDTTITRISGSAATESQSTMAEITIDDENEGDLTIEINEGIMAILGDDSAGGIYSRDVQLPKAEYFYDFQRKIAGGTLKTVAAGVFSVISDVSRATD